MARRCRQSPAERHRDGPQLSEGSLFSAGRVRPFGPTGTLRLVDLYPPARRLLNNR